MLPLLLEKILCKNKNEQLIVSWTKVVINANAKREVCVCAHTRVWFMELKITFMEFPLTLCPEMKVHLTQTCFNLARRLSLDTVTLSYRLAVTSELTPRVHVIELFL